MADPELDWSSASVTNGDVVVYWKGDEDLDEFFAAALRRMVERFQSEARGQRWGSIRLIKNGLSLAAVEAGTEDQLMRYLQEIIEASGRAAEEDRRRADQETTRRADSERQREADDEAMTRRFRELSS
jgi:tRNA(Ile2) C34 agmatinyltransferase TiaS